ncbi:MAG TPA: VOC family protein [Fimbriimonadaceae bacterium]|nr:VOC family protein [Fimbriimonadaceae bacterium]
MPSFDVGDGWLIFPMEGEVAFRASDDAKQEIALRCDDIDATVAELRERGVEFKGQIQDWDDGYGTLIVAPGGVLIQLYEPACAARI